MYDLTPETIKPALFCFDQYQTYDLLWATNLSTNVFNLLRNDLPYNFIFDPELNSLPVLLVDRYTPSKAPWAKHWTTQVYEFLKILSHTGIADNPYLNGEVMNFPPALDLNLPDGLTLEPFPTEITLSIPKGQELFLSWLEYGFDEGYSDYVSFNYSVKTRIINRRERVIKANEEAKIITLNTYGWMINSLILSSDYLETESQLLLYSDLESTLELILNQIGIPDEFQVYTGFDVQCNYRNSVRINSVSSHFYDSIFGNPVQTPIPDWYFFASLIYANNNHWGELDNEGNLEQLEDKGKEIAVLYQENRFNFIIWNYEMRYPLIEIIIPPPAYLGVQFSSISIPPYDIFDQCRHIVGRGSNTINFWWDYETGIVFSRSPDNRIEAIGHSVCTAEIYEGHEWTYTGDTNYIVYFLAFNFCCDSRLFKKSEGNYFYPRIGVLYYIEDELLRRAWFIERTIIKQTQTLSQSTDLVLEVQTEINFIENSINQIYEPQYVLEGEQQFNLQNALEMWDSPPDALQGLNADQVYLIVNNLFLGDTEGLVSTDSVRIKEIHAALNASEYAYDSDDPSGNAWWGLGRRIDAIASVNGLNFESDGRIRSIRQSKFIPQGESIPAGWSLGQWGRNEGGSTEGQTGGNEGEVRYGLAYPVRSGKFDQDPYTGKPEKINVGGYVLVESFPQLCAVMMDDLDRGLGLQEAGAMVIPNADGSNYSFFQGLTSFVAELLYMQSENSKLMGQTWVSCLKNQGMLLELIKQQGVPTGLKQIEVSMGDKEAPHKIPYTAFHSSAPTNFDLYIWVISHVSLLLAAQYGDDIYDDPNLYDDEETYPEEKTHE